MIAAIASNVITVKFNSPVAAFIEASPILSLLYTILLYQIKIKITINLYKKIVYNCCYTIDVKQIIYKKGMK